ncbi:hypothetical protein [Lysinibacillus xylanilyticus]|uniref:hypothetical protein n=1 Tax=Lysinibacillus xylanilyticus TaxID=582475 RepID=UPI0036DB0406
MGLEELLGKPVKKIKGFYPGAFGILDKEVLPSGESIYFIEARCFIQLMDISQIEVIKTKSLRNKK